MFLTRLCSAVVGASASTSTGARVRPLLGKRLPSRKALTVTKTAVDQVKMLMADNPGALGLRIGVKTRGCNGLTYTLEIANETQKFDEVVEQDGIRLYIDSKAQMSILGSEMDYQTDRLSSEFVFNNPNIKGTCGCGESFSV